MRTVSHYVLSVFRAVILEIPAPCAIETAPRKFAYGPTFRYAVIPHRADYSRADAQAVCDMLNARLARNKQASPAAAPLSGERGVSPSFPCADDGAPELDNCTAARGLTSNESC